MRAVHTRQSLRTRIIETERRAAIGRDQSYRPRRRQLTFAERYRGTEFEGPRVAVAEVEPSSLSRGRAFVLLAGAGAIGLCSLVVSAALSA